ncbi:MAG: histidine kinase, partial [Janthinobacterium sp.]
FQIVSEGISNIRKHTRARHGTIEVDCSNGWLQILIENEGDGAPAPAFTPSSIATRTAALGGRLLVKRPGDGGTSLQIAIPL